MDETGSLLPHLVICQLIAWALNYACVFNGVKSTGKVSYDGSKRTIRAYTRRSCTSPPRSRTS